MDDACELKKTENSEYKPGMVFENIDDLVTSEGQAVPID